MRAVSVALRAFRKPDVDLATLRRDDPAAQAGAAGATVFSLAGSPTQEALRSLCAAARRAVSFGAKTIRVDIDELAALDSAVIATLIVLLRSARESGASVVLRASRENIVGTLQTTALDKIFVVETATATSYLPALGALGCRGSKPGDVVRKRIIFIVGHDMRAFAVATAVIHASVRTVGIGDAIFNLFKRTLGTGVGSLACSGAKRSGREVKSSKIS